MVRQNAKNHLNLDFTKSMTQIWIISVILSMKRKFIREILNLNNPLKLQCSKVMRFEL
jgi:hypothetical protein